MGELTTLARGTSSDYAEPATLVIRDERAYGELWERLHGAGERPPVDFERHMVIAALMGQKPTGGYAIEIQGVGEEVTVAETTPSGFVTQALTSPYHVIRV